MSGEKRNPREGKGSLKRSASDEWARGSDDLPSRCGRGPLERQSAGLTSSENRGMHAAGLAGQPARPVCENGAIVNHVYPDEVLDEENSGE